MKNYKRNLNYLMCGATILLMSLMVKAQNEPQNPAQAEICKQSIKTSGFSQYAGRYRLSDGSVLIVEESDGELTLRPIFWRAVQPLSRRGGDSFGVEQREDRKVEFLRSAEGCVTAVKIEGFGDDGVFPRLNAEKVPIEFLLAGQPQIAAEQLIKSEPNAVENYVRIARTLFQRFPSKSSDAVEFLRVLVRHYPRVADVYSTLGDALIAAGKRTEALQSYRRAFELDKTNKTALKGLRRLNALPKSAQPNQTGWTLPFSLDKVFQKPTRAEIKAVQEIWAKRDLSPKDVTQVAQGKINLGYTEAEVRIISHSVHGQKHFGAIIIPDGIAAKAPVILDLKGVSWDYFPLNLNQIISPQILGQNQKRFIYVVPSFRGEILKFNGADYVSEGDRTDSWDGATDDALALLNAALKITPEADANRICAFGKSRGGSVALLAGIRDAKIKCVLDWAGPVDWFELMGTEGWTQKEIASDGLLNKSAPNEDGGQFIERFLAKAITGKWNLRDVRLKMIADSPIYFAERLPQRLQIHYGIEDEMVPVINGRALAEKLKKEGRAAPMFKAFFHANSGHDLNQKLAFKESETFLMSLLSNEK